MTDWVVALQIAGIGFAVVFLVLCLLATALWLVGVVTHKHSYGGGEKGKEG